jgi:hypothetical protein
VRRVGMFMDLAEDDPEKPSPCWRIPERASPESSQMSTRKAKCVLVFIGAKSNWTGPRPALFIPHVVVSRSLPRLLRALLA